MKFTEKSLFHNAKIVEDTLAKKVSIEVTSLYDKVYLNIEDGVMGASFFGLSKEKAKELATALILAYDALEEIEKIDK